MSFNDFLTITNLTSHLQVPVTRQRRTPHAITSLCPTRVWGLERACSQHMVHFDSIIPLSHPPTFFAHNSPTFRLSSPLRTKRGSSLLRLQTHQRPGIILPSSIFLHASPSDRLPIALMRPVASTERCDEIRCRVL